MDLNNLPLDQKITAIGNRIIEAQKQRADLEASALAHEEQARTDRRGMTELKKEIGELTTVLQHSQVAKTVNDAQAAALKAKADAEAAAAQQQETLAKVQQQSKELDELIAKAKAIEPKA